MNCFSEFEFHKVTAKLNNLPLNQQLSLTLIDINQTLYKAL